MHSHQKNIQSVIIDMLIEAPHSIFNLIVTYQDGKQDFLTAVTLDEAYDLYFNDMNAEDQAVIDGELRKFNEKWRARLFSQEKQQEKTELLEDNSKLCCRIL